jgi:tetratricopeptide (TPR) repeat protein
MYSFSGLSDCYTEKQELDKALHYCEKAMAKQVDEKLMIVASYYNYSRIFSNLKYWEKAIENFDKV